MSPAFDPTDKVHQGLAKKIREKRGSLSETDKRALAAELKKDKPNAGILARLLQR